jgi:DNA repair photolyase
MDAVPLVRGRGAAENPPNRFDRLHVELDPVEPGFVDDFDESGARAAEEVSIPTEYYRDATRTVISHNDSPDIPFTSSLNPYRGCEHGCIYCYARPYHEYLGLSAGLDFETRLFVKTDAPSLLRAELLRKAWQPTTLALSGVTDPYQPVERTLRITRGCLEVLAEFRNPVGVITKNALVTRDIDVLAELARVQAADVAVSVTTLDEDLRRVMEPRTSTAERRLDAIAKLNDAGVPAGVMVAPIIPGLNDHEVPRLLARAAEAGARFAGYTMVRLPHAVAPLFEAWLGRHFPDRQKKVLDRIREIRDGRLNDPNFGSRMRGAGPFADLVEEVFTKARDRAGIPRRGGRLSTAAFHRPTNQPSLF